MFGYQLVLVWATWFILGFMTTFTVPTYRMVHVDLGGSTLVEPGRWAMVSLLFAIVLSLIAVWILLPPSWRHALLPFRWPRRAVDAVAHRLPLVGAFLRFDALSRCLRSLAGLLRAGAPPAKALQLVAGVERHGGVRRALEIAVKRHSQGARVPDALAGGGAFPPDVIWLTRAGDGGGDLPAALAQAGLLCEGRARVAASALQRLVLPGIVVANGLMILAVAVSTYSPIVSISRRLLLW
jgi:type II secretory pathway component PulF